MEKPTAATLSTDGSHDMDLTERVVRQLQDSHLIVLEALGMSGLPEALSTGTPDDELSAISVALTMLTDGRKGFLILNGESPEYDVEREFTELVDSICPGSAARGMFVLRAAKMFDRECARRPRSLDLTDHTTVRATLEGAYEEAFEGTPPIDHDELLEAFRDWNFPVKHEGGVRSFFLDNPGPADAPEAYRPRVLRPRGRKIGRNERCPCGSGDKYKRCCLRAPAGWG